METIRESAAVLVLPHEEQVAAILSGHLHHGYLLLLLLQPMQSLFQYQRVFILWLFKVLLLGFDLKYTKYGVLRI